MTNKVPLGDADSLCPQESYDLKRDLKKNTSNCGIRQNVIKYIVKVKTCVRELKKKVMTSDLRDLEIFHGEGYFEIGLQACVSVQWGRVGVVKASEPKSIDSGKQNMW